MKAFRDLDPSIRAKLVDAMGIVEVSEGDYIVEMGGDADAMYIILSGEVVCHKGRGTTGQPEGAEGPQELVRLGQGQVFGESAIENPTAESGKRVANVVAVTTCRLAMLYGSDMARIIGSKQSAIMHSFKLKVCSALARWRTGGEGTGCGVRGGSHAGALACAFASPCGLWGAGSGSVYVPLPRTPPSRMCPLPRPHPPTALPDDQVLQGVSLLADSLNADEMAMLADAFVEVTRACVRWGANPRIYSCTWGGALAYLRPHAQSTHSPRICLPNPRICPHPTRVSASPAVAPRARAACTAPSVVIVLWSLCGLATLPLLTQSTRSSPFLVPYFWQARGGRDSPGITGRGLLHHQEWCRPRDRGRAGEPILNPPHTPCTPLIHTPRAAALLIPARPL